MNKHTALKKNEKRSAFFNATVFLGVGDKN